VRELGHVYYDQDHSWGKGDGLTGTLHEGPEPKVGERFVVPTQIVSSGKAEATGYLPFYPCCFDGPWPPPIAGWSVFILPIAEDPCDEDFMRDISS
jgi:hypothetical protein